MDSEDCSLPKLYLLNDHKIERIHVLKRTSINNLSISLEAENCLHSFSAIMFTIKRSKPEFFLVNDSSHVVSECPRTSRNRAFLCHCGLERRRTNRAHISIKCYRKLLFSSEILHFLLGDQQQHSRGGWEREYSSTQTSQNLISSEIGVEKIG